MLMAAQLVNVKFTELHTLSGCIVCYVNYISINTLKKGNQKKKKGINYQHTQMLHVSKRSQTKKK